MKISRLAPLLCVPALALAAPLLIPSQAQACGGTFCDNGPTTMPVDQTGENILFKIDDTSVEAHIQIQIDSSTEASQFAWVIPVTALPEFSVGSQILFDNLLAGSVPRYGLTFTNDSCSSGSEGDDGGEWGSAGETGGLTGTGDGDGDGDPGAPDVVFEGSVGAFEIAVLDGGTIEGVMTWLGDNGYQQDANAEPILAQYLEEEFLFVALKLGVETGVDEVHPIVIRYAGDEPCVPIRLTAIAADDDMDIRTFFLGDKRTVPQNYRHVLVNPLKLDWFNSADNYKEVISMAVDADEANGNAFVTEYAGPSNVITQANLTNPAWDAAEYMAFVDSPVGVIDALINDNLLFCDSSFDDECVGLHPLIDPIVAQFVPVPDGVTEAEFYECLDCYPDLIDIEAWDANAMATMLQERIFDPGSHAVDLLDNNPYLTRMYTTISPSEMNADPIFTENDTLPDVVATRQANQRTLCDGSVIVTLPDDREIFFPAGAALAWPDFQDEMPWDEDIDENGMAANAPLINLVDNTEKINELLEDYNKDKGYGTPAIGGCGCTLEQSGAGGSLALGFLTLGMFGLVRRRRQR